MAFVKPLVPLISGALNGAPARAAVPYLDMNLFDSFDWKHIFEAM